MKVSNTTLKVLSNSRGVIELKNVTVTLIHGQLLYQHMYNLSLEFVNKLHKVLVIHEKKELTKIDNIVVKFQLLFDFLPCLPVDHIPE